MKKFIAIVLVSFISIGLAFSKESEPLDENFRYELNISDTLFAGIFSYGNTTDVGMDFTWLNNRLGFRVGAMVRESMYYGKNKLNVSWNPYVGFSFFNGCVMAGASPWGSSDDVVTWMPYFGFNWDFDVIPVKNGFSNSLAIRVGTDVYIDLYDHESLESLVYAIFSFMPRLYVGVTYKIGAGVKKEAQPEPSDFDGYGEYGNPETVSYYDE